MFHFSHLDQITNTFAACMTRFRFDEVEYSGTQFQINVLSKYAFYLLPSSPLSILPQDFASVSKKDKMGSLATPLALLALTGMRAVCVVSGIGACCKVHVIKKYNSTPSLLRPHPISILPVYCSYLLTILFELAHHKRRICPGPNLPILYRRTRW